MSHLDSRPSTSRASRETEDGEDNEAAPMYSKDWYQKRRLLTCNQVVMLRDRELGRRRRDTNQYRHDRDLYTTVPLDRHVVAQEMMGPRDHILGWTPDGLRLITLSFHLDTLKIYRYNGVQAAKSVRDDQVLNELFTLQSEIKVRQIDVQFRLECVLFTDDARHLIVPATANVNDNQLSLETLFRTNEGVPYVNGHIEDFYFYCIDVAKGAVVSQHVFRRDRIILPHGVQISKRFLCVTSHQHQVMHLLRIHPQTGALIPLKDIGPSVLDDDDLHLPVTQASHLRTNFVSGFKQRILTFLYQRAKGEGKIAEFLRSSEYFSQLRLDKVHIFEEFFLLIRMLPLGDFGRETSSLPCFFVIMDWRDASILDIYNAFDERFYNCVVSLSPSLLFPITTDAWVGADLFPVHAWMAIRRGRKRGDPRHSPESLRRLLNQLPFPSYQPYKISAQTPYLDPSLFLLDDKIAAGITNGKLRLDNEDPRFMSSRSGRVAFQLPLSVVCNGTLRQVSLLFHPRDPLCLGSDRLRTDPCVLVFLPSSQPPEKETVEESDQ